MAVGDDVKDVFVGDRVTIVKPHAEYVVGVPGRPDAQVIPLSEFGWFKAAEFPKSGDFGYGNFYKINQILDKDLISTYN